MDAIVTARVPVEIKDQVTQILSEIGSSPTKLINAAYEYVLKEHRLPGVEEAPRDKGKPIVRTLTPEQQKEFEEFLAATQFDVPASFWDELGDRSYKELIADWRAQEYEALS